MPQRAVKCNRLFEALLECLPFEAREGGRKREAWDEGEAAIPGRRRIERRSPRRRATAIH